MTISVSTQASNTHTTIPVPLPNWSTMPPPSSTIPQSISRKRKLAPAAVSSSSRLHSRTTMQIPLTSNIHDARAIESSPGTGAGDDEEESESEEQMDEDKDDDFCPGYSARATSAASRKASSSKKPALPGSSTKTSSTGPGSSSTPLKAPTVGPNGRQLSREQLRKANHSLIERRRREKINFALSELRSMVPGLGDDGGKGGEFKLEVLERTVLHMRELKKYINELETQVSKRSSGDESHASSWKKRKAHEKETDVHMSASKPLKTGQQEGRPSTTPPSPSLSPEPSRTEKNVPEGGENQHDPNSKLEEESNDDTEVESNLPPPLTLASSRNRDFVDDRQMTYDHHSHDFSAHHFSQAMSEGTSPRAPSLASLLHEANKPSQQHHSYPNSAPMSRSSSSSFTSPHHSHSHPQPTRPPPPPQATNPTLYLPFPTPSPTSPFLTYHSGIGTSNSASTSATTSISSVSSTTGPPEPSPFLAPLGGISLFGGALNFDSTMANMVNLSPSESISMDIKKTSGSHDDSPPNLVMPPPLPDVSLSRVPVKSSKSSHSRSQSRSSNNPSSSHEVGTEKKDGIAMPPEEAANLLLAFSSPDTLRPSSGVAFPPGLGLTPIFPPINGNGGSGRIRGRRRGTLDSEEEFTLDGGLLSKAGSLDTLPDTSKRVIEKTVMGDLEVRGKTARDILKM